MIQPTGKRMANAKLVNALPTFTTHGLEITLKSQYERRKSPLDFPENATSVLSKETMSGNECAKITKAVGFTPENACSGCLKLTGLVIFTGYDTAEHV
jgi:hypothetical protein